MFSKINILGMKKILKTLLLLGITISFFWVNINSNILSYNNWVYASDNYIIIDKDSWTERNNKLSWFSNGWKFLNSSKKGAEWIYDTLIQAAKDLKNVFFALAIIFYLVIVIKILVSDNAEEEWNKFKKWVLWITVWIIVMQAWVAIMVTLYDKKVWWNLAFSFLKGIIFPIIWLLQVMASVLFLWIALYVFYQLATANWNEEQTKSWKMSILYALIWFIVVHFTKVIVDSTYGTLWSIIWKPDESKIASSVLDILTWINWFVGLIVIIMIIWSWFQILTSNWDDEKIKKAKKSIIYIFIWIFILITNYLILTFFLWTKI